ncbi:MAG: hypothetical protein [Cressdnaviricota sp.]|nr:MAG: hypothetical protein [Cressdnaviricota sp.]
MPPSRTKPKRKRTSNAGKFKRHTKRKATPRRIIKSSPGSAPNVHMFKRSYDHPFTIGVADHTNGVFLNTDNKYMIVKLHTKFNKLPNYDEFKALFSEYKITSVDQRLIPFYSQNQPYASTPTRPEILGVPNFEIFSLPVNSSAQEHDLSTYTATQIDDYINQSQRKARRMMPSKSMMFKTLHPKVVGYKGPLDKGAGNSLMTMEAPAWLNTDNAAAGMLDQTDVTHYGVVLLIRRVDGVALPATSSKWESMGFRMENTVYFKTRKVQ